MVEAINEARDKQNEGVRVSVNRTYAYYMQNLNRLVLQWNDLKLQPEIVEAIERVEKRKRQEAEAKRKEQVRQSRFQGVLNRFISEGQSSLG